MYGDHHTKVPMPCGHSSSIRYILLHLCEPFYLWEELHYLVTKSSLIWRHDWLFQLLTQLISSCEIKT